VKTQNQRKVRWDKERNQAYVVRDGVRYWAPDGTMATTGEDVQAFNPDGRQVLVRWRSWFQTWLADATPPPPVR
jgi:hypothetical protein